MDDEFRPQIINGKHPLNNPNGYPSVPRRPMDVHPNPHLGPWVSMDEYGELSMLSMVLHQPEDV